MLSSHLLTQTSMKEVLGMHRSTNLSMVLISQMPSLSPKFQVGLLAEYSFLLAWVQSVH